MFRQRKRALSEHRRTIIIITLLGAAVFVGLSDFLVVKIAATGFSDDSRLAVYWITLRSIVDAPVFGH